MDKLFKRKTWFWAVCTLIVGVGCYNAMVFNAVSDITGDHYLAEHLPEAPVKVSKRAIAVETTWSKLESPKPRAVVQEVRKVSSAPQKALPAEAAIKEDLNLQLVEVVNSRKWKEGVRREDFFGNLVASGGVMEAFDVALPGGDNINIAFSEIAGNVFQYDLHGEIYEAMVFQADKHSYFVTLTNGPFEGTRLRFAQQPSPEQVEIERTLASEHDVQVGHFGLSAAPSAEVHQPEEQVMAFNLESTDA
jgi:hypothetical protein